MQNFSHQDIKRWNVIGGAKIFTKLDASHQHNDAKGCVTFSYATPKLFSKKCWKIWRTPKKLQMSWFTLISFSNWITQLTRKPIPSCTILLNGSVIKLVSLVSKINFTLTQEQANLTQKNLLTGLLSYLVRPLRIFFYNIKSTEIFMYYVYMTLRQIIH